MREEIVKAARRAVVKVGTRVLSDERGALAGERIVSLASQVARLRGRGIEVILVSSGAIGAGVSELSLPGRPSTLPRLQAAASVGQSILMKAYQDAFAREGVKVGQVLLTHEDLGSRRRHLNARNTLGTLLSLGVLPIVNENDTVAVAEIKFGDNDRLSALVANLVQADLLVVLTDIDGLMTGDPGEGGEVRLISEVRRITPELEAIAKGTRSPSAAGGMRSKIAAVRIVTRSGLAAVIANGRREGVLEEVFSGRRVGTFFLPEGNRMAARKRWIAFFRAPTGEIVVDEGAQRALCASGKSLLASGVTEVRGRFRGGASVRVVDRAGREIARGISYYSSDQLQRIKGARTDRIARILGRKDYDEVIHRDNLVIM